MASKTVVCIDTSGSTVGNHKYFEKIKDILQSEKEKLIITWNSNAEITTSETFHSTGGTFPQTFLNLLKDFDYDYNLIVTTDGQIGDYDLRCCKDIINSSRLLSRIKSFMIYFIGEPKHMNLRISSLFNRVEKKHLIINENEPIAVMNINLVDELKLEHFKNDNNIVATVLTLIQTYPDKKNELRSQICKVGNRIMSELATKSSIKEFYEKGDVEGCVDFVKNYDNSDKKAFQQAMSKVLNIFKKNDDYSLSHLSNANVCKKQKVEATALEDFSDYDENTDFICDILMTKCSLPCILIKSIEDHELGNKDTFSIIPDKLSKKIAEHPFLIFDHEDIVQKIVKRVEHQTIDLYAYNNLEDKSKSPFTRDRIKGVYILHNNEADYDLIFKHNNRTLSFIFGNDNKLPGNKTIWNVLFLYVLIRHHPAWKEHESKLKEEILYICKNVTSLVTLTPMLNPTISEKFEVCLWYIFNVAPKAFENTSSNVLRFIEGPEKFVEFYSDIFGKNCEDISNKLKIWNLWKYFARNKSNKNLKLEVSSQIQNHQTINDSIVLFSGQSECNQSKCVCKKFNNVEPHIVFALYDIFKTKSNPKLFDYIDIKALTKDKNKTERNIIVKNNFNEEMLKHISICSSTCNPTVMCPITGKHWKECIGNYDINTESYVRLFKRFCLAKRKYPTDENDLLVFYSNRINFNEKDAIVCPPNIKNCLKITIDKYSTIMKEYPVDKYMKLCQVDCNEVKRAEIEKKCNKCDLHKKFNTK